MTYTRHEFVFNTYESFLENLARFEKEPWTKCYTRAKREDIVREYLFGRMHQDKYFTVHFNIAAPRYRPEHEAPADHDWKPRPRFMINMHMSPADEKNRKFMQDIIDWQMKRMNRDLSAAIHYGITPEKPVSILDKAKKTVDSSRQDEYGDPVENWVATALIATITQRKSITPEDVIQVMCAAKGVRAGRSHKEDTNIDSAGYAEIRERVQKAFADGTVQKIVEKLLGGWVKFALAKPEPNAILHSIDIKGDNMFRPGDAYVTFKVNGPIDINSFGKSYNISKV